MRKRANSRSGHVLFALITLVLAACGGTDTNDGSESEGSSAAQVAEQTAMDTTMVTPSSSPMSVARLAAGKLCEVTSEMAQRSAVEVDNAEALLALARAQTFEGADYAQLWPLINQDFYPAGTLSTDRVDDAVRQANAECASLRERGLLGSNVVMEDVSFACEMLALIDGNIEDPVVDAQVHLVFHFSTRTATVDSDVDEPFLTESRAMQRAIKESDAEGFNASRVRMSELCAAPAPIDTPAATVDSTPSEATVPPTADEPLAFADASEAAITTEELAARHGGSWTFETPTRLNAYEIDGTAIAIDQSECNIQHSATAENLSGTVFDGIDTYEQWFFEGPGYEDPLNPGEVTHYDIDGGQVANITTALFPSPADAAAFFGEVSGLICGNSEMKDLQGEPLINRFVTTVEVPGFDEVVVGSHYLSGVAVGRSGSVVVQVGFSSGELEPNPVVAPDGPAQDEVVEFLTWLRTAI